jgi:CheY-like chemotaxis protein
MISALPAILSPLLVLLVWIFLVYRFGFFGPQPVGGRGYFVAGGILLLCASGWGVVGLLPGYNDWFLTAAYPAIDLAQYLVGAVGGLLAIVGLALYADFWQVRREDIEERTGKLAVLDHLHQDSRQPYHLLELLNIALREILIHYPMAAGSILLVNHSRRQFLLTSSSGLRKEEIARLEYYPLERNPMSQAVELGDPILTSTFEFIERGGRKVPSRFQSVLLLPLSTGLRKIGCLALFSEEPSFFDREDIGYLSPVAQWLAEKINTGRLERELNRAQTEREQFSETLTSFLARLAQVSRALSAADAPGDYCRSLVGLVGAESVHLGRVAGGELTLAGGSEPLLDLSESFRAAIIDAMSRSKPLVINQEARDNGESRLVQSSLVYPMNSRADDGALIFIRTDQAFTVSDLERRQLDCLAAMGRLLFQFEVFRKSRLSRRQGFDAVLRLLQKDIGSLSAYDAIALFADTLTTALPKHSQCSIMQLAPDGRAFRSSGSSDEFELAIDEAGLGNSLKDRTVKLVAGRGEVRAYLDNLHDQTRANLHQLWGELGHPDLIAHCPLNDAAGETYLVLVQVFEAKESDCDEWGRLIRLAAGLYSLRLAMAGLTAGASHEPKPATIEAPAEQIDAINNLLFGVIGAAELLGRNRALPQELQPHLADLIDRTERASRLITQTLAVPAPSVEPEISRTDSLNRVIQSELAPNRLSGDLYMAGQRPREIRLMLEPLKSVAFADDQMRRLFLSVLNRFAVMADEDDVITIATYQKGGYAFLDLSRHRRNFPAVDQVAGFGRYLFVPEALRSRPEDIFLRHLADGESYYAVDASSSKPAFLSFKFPLASANRTEAASRKATAGHLLAIDDQQVILDLMVAMGRTLGYSVDTAGDAEAGLRAAEQNQYQVILIDLSMPGLSGLEAARRLRLLQPDTPLILVTGWTTEISRTELEASGVTEVLHKPFRIEQLTSVVQSVIRNRI